MPDHIPQLDDDDFGFSLVSQADIALPTQDEKLEGLIKMIMPLLDNLMADPEKEYLYWPGRAEKIKAFKEKIQKYIE